MQNHAAHPSVMKSVKLILLKHPNVPLSGIAEKNASFSCAQGLVFTNYLKNFPVENNITLEGPATLVMFRLSVHFFIGQLFIEWQVVTRLFKVSPIRVFCIKIAKK